MEQEHVAGLDHHAVGGHDLLQRGQVDRRASRAPRWWAQVDEHAAALHAVERPCARGRGAWRTTGGRRRRRAASSLRADEVDAGSVAVVVDGLLHAVAVGVELGADVGERVPLRGVLQREGHDVVGPHVDVLGVAEVGHLAHVDVEEGGRRCRPCPRSGASDGRVAALVQRGAAGEVERQAQAEADAGLHLGARPASTFSGVSRLMRPSSSSSPQSPHVEPSGAASTASSSVATVLTRWLACNRRSRSTRTTFPLRGGPTRWRRRTSSSRATGTSSSRSTSSRPACPKHLRDRGRVGGGLRDDEPFVEGGATVLPPAAHRRLRGLDGLPLPPDQRPHARGRPRAHPRGHGPRRRRRPGAAPEPLAVRPLLRRPRALDRPRPRLQRLRRRAVLAVLPPARPDRADPAVRRRRRRRRDRAGRRRRVPGRRCCRPRRRAATTRATSTRCGPPLSATGAAAVLPHADRRRERQRHRGHHAQGRPRERRPGQPADDREGRRQADGHPGRVQHARPVSSSSASSSAAACPSATPTSTSR